MNTKKEGDRMLRVDQVATRLTVSIRKVYYLVAQEKLAVVRIGERGIRIRQSEVDKLLGIFRSPSAKALDKPTQKADSSAETDQSGDTAEKFDKIFGMAKKIEAED